MSARTNSSVGGIAWTAALRECLGYARCHWQDLRSGRELDEVERDVAGYDAACRAHVGIPLAEARALEIGFGPRPFRLCWLASTGVDVHGVDLDRPLIDANRAELRAIVGANGWFRAAKSLARHLVFDRLYLRRFRARAAQRGHRFVVPYDRLLVSDASDPEFWDAHGARGFDFVYSDDVFEHVPVADLERLLAQVAGGLSDRGVLFCRPMVFTGISGGHHPEWYVDFLDRPRRHRVEPWDHLRQRRAPVNTYLNELRRSDYRDLFERWFEIVEERVEDPDAGREHLTPAVRAELADYTDDELFSNRVVWVLRPRREAAAEVA